MAEKRAGKRAATQAKNQSANPRRAKKKKPRPEAPAPQAKAKVKASPRAAARLAPSDEPRLVSSSSVPSSSAPDSAPRRIAPRPEKKRAVAPSTRVAVAILLALGLMLGFWLIFRSPSS